MITAKEAFEKTVTQLQEHNVIDLLLMAQERIQSAVEKGGFAVFVGPCPFASAEKLAIELEEFGYCVSVQNAGIINEKNEPLMVVNVNWRFKPAINSRVDSTVPCN